MVCFQQIDIEGLHFQLDGGRWRLLGRLDSWRGLQRQGPVELVEQELLLGLRLRIAGHDQPAAVGGGQADIEHLNRAEFFQHRAGCEAWR